MIPLFTDRAAAVPAACPIAMQGGITRMAPAAVEPGSWCGSDDACAIWDVTYDHKPRQFCECGGIMYYTFGTVKFKCIVCGKEIDISNEQSRPIGDSPEGGPGRRPRRRRP